MRSARAIIHLNRLHENYALLTSLAPHSKILAMIKADAYGHGLVPVAQTLAEVADAFGVCCLQEAMTLRKAGIRTPIVLMEGVFSDDELSIADELSLQLVLHQQQQIDGLFAYGRRYPHQLWLKCNTGMNRLGFSPKQFINVLEQLQAKNYEPILMSHLACADEKNHPLNETQIQTFSELTEERQLPRSLLNSAGIYHFNQCQYDWVRPGLALYGVAPMTRAQTAYTDLKPVMSLESMVMSIYSIATGETVGYGADWQAQRPSKIAVLSIGYGDGYPRDVPNGMPVLINDELFPTVGRVSMDMMAVDITEAKKPIQLGASVQLWGEQLLVETVAKKLNRIPYELLTQVTARPNRVMQST